MARFEELGRVLGSYPESQVVADGPLVIVIGGMHGNEPAGIAAARRVLGELTHRRPPLRGRVVALSGNLSALRFGQRYLSEDLNRVWTDERIEALRASDPAQDVDERREQRELLEAIEELLAGSWERVILLDLHSTSAEGSPFVIMADSLQNRDVAFSLGVPVILGLEERVDGTMLSYMSERGHSAVCLEGGQNDLPSTIDHHEAAVWIALVAAGLLTEDEVPEMDRKRRLLLQTAWGLPPVVEIRHRHPVEGDGFEMLPGFTNFHLIEEGDVLARTGHGAEERSVRSPLGGLLIMPRYQGLGEDAFFVGREVRPMWLRLSALLRRLRLEWCLPLLPGIRRDRSQPRVLLADTRVARWHVLELLHLFGYRRSGQAGSTLTFLRRRDTR